MVDFGSSHKLGKYIVTVYSPVLAYPLSNQFQIKEFKSINERARDSDVHTPINTVSATIHGLPIEVLLNKEIIGTIGSIYFLDMSYLM